MFVITSLGGVPVKPLSLSLSLSLSVFFCFYFLFKFKFQFRVVYLMSNKQTKTLSVHSTFGVGFTVKRGRLLVLLIRVQKCQAVDHCRTMGRPASCPSWKKLLQFSQTLWICMTKSEWWSDSLSGTHSYHFRFSVTWPRFKVRTASVTHPVKCQQWLISWKIELQRFKLAGFSQFVSGLFWFCMVCWVHLRMYKNTNTGEIYYS